MNPKPIVLYVDDEKPNLTAFRSEFREWYDVRTAQSGQEALEILQKEQIPVIIADQRMPGMTGTELLETIKLSRPRSIRMIMTGYSDIDAVVDALNKSRVYHYFQKPWNRTELRMTIDNALDSQRLESKLIDSEQRYRTLFENAAEGILVVDIETKKIRYANPAICTMLGYDLEVLTNLEVMDIHPQESLERVLSEFEAQAKGEKTLAPEIPCLCKGGRIVYADINTKAVEFDGRMFNFGLFTDITERRQAELELRRHRDNLEELVKERTAEITRGAQELERFNKSMVGRESRIIELKKQVNELTQELGREPPYRMWDEQ